MTDALMVSNILLWIVILVMGVVVLALIRQIGILYERVAPAGALMVGRGLKVGESAPAMDLKDITGHAVRIGGERSENRSTLLFFSSPTCPVCNVLLPVIKSIRKDEAAWLDILLASDGETRSHYEHIAKHKLEDFPYLLSTELGLRYQVGKLPYAVLIDDKGMIRSKGLVNSREHLESMFEAQERGVASLQEYLSVGQRGQ